MGNHRSQGAAQGLNGRRYFLGGAAMVLAEGMLVPSVAMAQTGNYTVYSPFADRGSASFDGSDVGQFGSSGSDFQSPNGPDVTGNYGGMLGIDAAYTGPGTSITINDPNGTGGLTTDPFVFSVWLPSPGAPDSGATLYTFTGSQEESLSISALTGDYFRSAARLRILIRRPVSQFF